MATNKERRSSPGLSEKPRMRGLGTVSEIETRLKNKGHQQLVTVMACSRLLDVIKQSSLL